MPPVRNRVTTPVAALRPCIPAFPLVSRTQCRPHLPLLAVACPSAAFEYPHVPYFAKHISLAVQ
ncbi:hypothetical protein DENSPDRAFT_846283 [Dentipellis sp. KUC8613]|nr:hypothetical protein DENSPDRAFT_846283 [Dentipellis sp. KUC8613]